jgi:hypothetical protein
MNPGLTSNKLNSSIHKHKMSASVYEISSSDPDELFETAVGRGWRPPRGTFVGLRRVNQRHTTTGSTQRQMLDTNGAVMPDGGVSPCIIKVIGVGGGGCNAVGLIVSCKKCSNIHHLYLLPCNV